MKKEYKTILSLIFKALVICFVVTGILLSYFCGHVNGYSVLLFFTTQSNIWIAVMDVLLIFFIIKALKKQEDLSEKAIKAYQVFVTCITITGLVYCLILAPGYYLSDVRIENYSPFNFAAVLLHIVVPLLSFFDFVFLTRPIKFKIKELFYVFIPTAYYFVFAIIGYVLNFDFGEGRNYPYFFLNFDSPAGIFGFSKVMPYFMGSFYWFIVIFGIICLISFFYIKISNKRFLKLESTLK